MDKDYKIAFEQSMAILMRLNASIPLTAAPDGDRMRVLFTRKEWEEFYKASIEAIDFIGRHQHEGQDRLCLNESENT